MGYTLFPQLAASVAACVIALEAALFSTPQEAPVAPSVGATISESVPIPPVPILGWSNAKRWHEQSGAPFVLLITERPDAKLAQRIRSLLDMTGHPNIVLATSDRTSQIQVWRFVRQPRPPSLTWLVKWKGVLAVDHARRPPLAAPPSLKTLSLWCSGDSATIPKTALAPIGYCPVRPNPAKPR